MTDAQTEITQQTALVPVDQRAKLALATTERESKLIAAAASTKDITACADKTGREMIHKAAMGHRALRLDIKSTGEAAREDATKFQRAVIAEVERLTAIIAPEETRLLAIRDGWDAEQERIRQEAIAKEQARIATITAAIQGYRDIPLSNIGSSAHDLDATIESMNAAPLPDLEYKGDEEAKVLAAKNEAIEKLEEMEAAAIARETAERQAAEARAAEEARIKAEREAEAKRQAEQRAELERQQAELAAARAKAEAEAKAAREKLEAEAAELRKAQEAALAAEREAMAKERAAMEEERARVAEEVAAMERQREEAAKAAAMLAPAAEPEKTILTVDSVTVSVGGVECKPYDDPTIMDEANAEAESVGIPTLRLGQMSERLRFTVTADFLLFLGFAHSGTDKAAKLFHESEFPAICAAISRHVLEVAQK